MIDRRRGGCHNICRDFLIDGIYENILSSDQSRNLLFFFLKEVPPYDIHHVLRKCKSRDIALLLFSAAWKRVGRSVVWAIN